MAKSKTRKIIFTLSPGKYGLAYFVGDHAELPTELANVLVDEGFAIAETTPEAPAKD
jgi:hypothetical protein